MERRIAVPALALAALLASTTLAGAGSLGSPFSEGSGYAPLVPVSAFARPAAWFDPSRLHVTTELSFGTGFTGQSSGLQVTRLSYQFGAPLAMQVSVGNAFGGGVREGGQFFLEGLDLQYRPFRSMLLQVNYRDLRSPLQYGWASPYLWH
jgi:hypothetical protein